MKILLIRHGDPDYVHDTLTEKGHREAALLAEKLAKVPITDYFVSPLGRARDTAAYTLKKKGAEAKTFEWLKEFNAMLDINGSPELINAFTNLRKKEDGSYEKRIVWDLMPDYWMTRPEYFTPDGWRDSEIAKRSNMIEVYDHVVTEFDKVLAEKGYVREGVHYRAEKANTDTIAFFCHFGVSCVLLSRLWNVSPFVLWHETVMVPSAVTELVTEERHQGFASFRSLSVGDVSHLYAGGEEPSFAARFCETFDSEERH